jgi:dTDP-4-amino-4,6-dideoxygalactose transaminase
MRDLSSNHLYILKVNFKQLGKSRAKLMVDLKNEGIVTQVHYIPVTSHPFFKEKNYDLDNLTNAYSYYEKALSIPLFYDLSEEQQQYVIEKVKKLIG